MRPRLATVLSGRDWEPELVEVSRRTGRLRIVGRAYQPEDLDTFGPVDAIAVGSETAWINPEFISRWKRRGTRVIGVHPVGDIPGATLFHEARVDLVTPDTTEAADLVHRIGLLSLDPTPVSAHSRIVLVTGVQGAPGRTSVAVGLGLALANALLIDAEICPGVGPRFSLPPDTTWLKIADQLLEFSHPQSSERLFGSSRLQSAVAEGRTNYANVIIDRGILDPMDKLLRSSDTVILVVDASTTGLIRASRSLERWTWQEPVVVLNKVDYPSDVQSCRYATGIEPAAIIPRLDTSNPTIIAEEIRAHLQALAQGLCASG